MKKVLLSPSLFTKHFYKLYCQSCPTVESTVVEFFGVVAIVEVDGVPVVLTVEIVCGSSSCSGCP